VFKGFNYFLLDSKDAERTCRFYEALSHLPALGGRVTEAMAPAGRRTEYYIELAERTVRPPIIKIQTSRLPGMDYGGSEGWDHLALEVSDCALACREVEQAGGRIEKWPTDNIMGDVPIINAVVYGLNGEKLELVQVPGQQEEAGNQEFRLRLKIIGTSHMQLNTSDVEKSRAFYEAAFNGIMLSPVLNKDNKTIKGYLVQIAPGAVLEIQPPRFGKSGDVRCEENSSAWKAIAIETDDIEAACRQIEAAGGKCAAKPAINKLPCPPAYSRACSALGGVDILKAVVIGTENECIELIQII
jgi:catechol 2,3-dioxygenase-like lactoylglutathione lyase family enzyme